MSTIVNANTIQEYGYGNKPKLQIMTARSYI